jgi:hypothetical protein
MGVYKDPNRYQSARAARLTATLLSASNFRGVHGSVDMSVQYPSFNPSL